MAAVWWEIGMRGCWEVGNERLRWCGVWGDAGEEDSDGGREGGRDEGIGKKWGRVLAICPVVRAPSGQGEKTAPWLTNCTCMLLIVHTHTHECIHTRSTQMVYTHTLNMCVNSQLFKYTPGFCQICRKWIKHDAGCYKRHFNFFIYTLSEHAYVQKATTHILHTMCTQSPGFPDARGEGSANSIACQHNLLS